MYVLYYQPYGFSGKFYTSYALRPAYGSFDVSECEWIVPGTVTC